MVLVTVVGELQCRKGLEFVFGGPLAECRDCKVRNVCFHLEEGRIYRVTAARDVHHECKVHEGGVRVVEVEKVPTRTAIEKSAAVEGSLITFEESDCDWIGCENFRVCRPAGASEGMKFRVISVGEVLDCPRGRALRVAVLD
jgi:uncharacterized protein (UPF0179 family)